MSDASILLVYHNRTQRSGLLVAAEIECLQLSLVQMYNKVHNVQ